MRKRCHRLLRSVRGYRLLVLVLLAAVASPLRAGEAQTVLPNKDIAEIRAWIDARSDMQVLALGESAHDSPVTQRIRNQLILDLAKRDRIGLIILESGFAESRLIYAYTSGQGLGGRNVQGGLTNGFGLFAPNLELIEVIRSINVQRPDTGRIGVLGMDLSAGGPWGASPGMAPVECVLGASNLRKRGPLRERFQRLTGPGLRGEPVSPAIIARYRAAFSDLKRSLPRSYAQEIGMCLRIVEYGAQLLVALPRGTPGTGLPADAWRSIEVRDRAMAEMVEALVPFARGKLVVVVTHLTHAAASEMVGPRWMNLEKAPQSMGTWLQQAMGSGYGTALILADQAAQGCGAIMAGVVVRKLPDRPCAVTVNGDDSQLLTLSSAADIVIMR